jgi:hypothetical protein
MCAHIFSLIWNGFKNSWTSIDVGSLKQWFYIIESLIIQIMINEREFSIDIIVWFDR